MSLTLEKAGTLLRGGQPLIFPTDTVWGLGVAVAHCDDPGVIYDIKGRDRRKPISWLIGSHDELSKYGRDLQGYVFDLARDRWPGAMTLVVEASDRVPWAYRSADGSIGLRMPNSQTALSLADIAGSPIAATSANIAGKPSRPSRSSFDAVNAGLGGIPVFEGFDGDHIFEGPKQLSISDLNSHRCMQSEASTVIDCRGEKPRVLREGPIVI